MFRKIITNKAINDLIEIWDYIWQDNLYYASKVLKSIDEVVDTILKFPYIWKSITHWHRMIIETQYKFKIIYRISWNIIYIVSIFKYKKDFE